MTTGLGRSGWGHLRQSTSALFEDDDPDNRVAWLVRRGLILLVIVSVAGIVLGTVQSLRETYDPWFSALETGAVAIFTLEYGLRLWSAPDQPMHAGQRPWAARARVASSASGLIDLAAVAPALLGWAIDTNLSIFLLLRLTRFFKLARYSPGMRSLAAVLQAERRALLASAVILLGFVILAAAAMYGAEHVAQPDKLGSIPAAMWWAVVTLTTVGYGDVYPVTVLGRLVASTTMVFGLMMLALPVGIVATAFAEEIHRREFVVTWGMIARIPLFATLSASEIGDITRFLNARTVPAGATIVRKGEAANSMYVIASGEVEVDLPTGAVRLGQGQFFGERALIENAQRSATVRATEATRLLVLDATDLKILMDRNGDVAARIRNVASQRQTANQSGPQAGPPPG